MRKLIVITAGLSTPSSTRALAQQLADATKSKVSARGEGLEVEFVELRELAIELAEAMTNWGATTPRLDEVKRAISVADAMIAVTPAFQGSYSGLFKMFFDTLDPAAMNGLPVLIGATGGSSRHALMLDFAVRPLFNYLKAVVVPTGIYQATEDFGTEAGAEQSQRIVRAAQELADLIVGPTDRVSGLSGHTTDSAAPRSARPTGLDLEESFVDFSTLLHGHDGHIS